MNRLVLGGVIGPFVFSAVVILSAALREDYSHIADFISDLGATGSSRAVLMNVAGFIPGGLGLVGFGVALGRILPRNPITRTATSLLVLFGSGVAASGIISCDPGCPQTGGSFANSVHDKIAPVSFLCAISASCLLGFSFRNDSEWKSVSFYSLATGVLALGFLVLLVNSLESREFTGLWQRLLLVDLFSWCAVIAVKADRQANRPTSRTQH